MPGGLRVSHPFPKHFHPFPASELWRLLGQHGPRPHSWVKGPVPIRFSMPLQTTPVSSVSPKRSKLRLFADGLHRFLFIKQSRIHICLFEGSPALPKHAFFPRRVPTGPTVSAPGPLRRDESLWINSHQIRGCTKE